MSNQDHVERADRDIIKNTLPAVVQIVALKKGLMGNLSSVWTGSGTIVDPKGIILTNCHVANPRAMGMPSPAMDRLAISITERSDDAPVLTYYADIIGQDPKLDLAVLKIVERVDRKSIKRLKLPFLPIGDSDDLELGDIMSIFGFPGIGGDTVTLTSGNVSGFTKQRGVSARRAWVKTDATIAGGNSGGTAVNHEGKLVGIPTQASAGEGIIPVDARPVVDTNRDGRIDQRDTPMAIGGFINGLRPINLAKPLLEQAGVSTSRRRSSTASSGAKKRGTRSTTSSARGGRQTPSSGSRKPRTAPRAPRTAPRAPRTAPRAPRTAPRAPRSTPTRPVKKAGPAIDNLVFCSRVTRDGRPINPTAKLRSGLTEMYVTFSFEGLRNRSAWGQVWSVNGQKIMEQNDKWEDGASGRKVITLINKPALPDGEYHLAITFRNQIIAEGGVVVGRRVQVDDNDTQLSGQIVNQRTGRGIGQALVIALKPTVRVNDFVRRQRPNMAQTSTRTDRNGRFTFPQQLPKGEAYGLVVVARGYRDMVIEGALRVSPNAPEKAEINPLALIRE